MKGKLEKSEYFVSAFFYRNLFFSFFPQNTLFLNLAQLNESKRKQYPNAAFIASPLLPPSFLKHITHCSIRPTRHCSDLQSSMQRQYCGSLCSWWPISPWNRASKSTKLSRSHHSWNHLWDGLGTFAVKTDQRFSDRTPSPCLQCQARYPWEN